MKKLEQEWRSYRNEVLGNNASWTQLTECRRAFFAGAQSVFTTMLEERPPTTAGETKVVQDLALELQAFLREVKDGKA